MLNTPSYSVSVMSSASEQLVVVVCPEFYPVFCSLEPVSDESSVSGNSGIDVSDPEPPLVTTVEQTKETRSLQG